MIDADIAVKSSNIPRFRLKQLMLAIAVICVTLAFLSRPLIQTLNNGSHRKWLRASPFTKVRVEGNNVMVEFNDNSYQLISINGATTEQILKAADRNFGVGWGTKRFVEDLPAVLGVMGKIGIDQETVSLVLQDFAGKQISFPDAQMTAGNRIKVYRNSRNKTPGVPGDTGLTWTLFSMGAVFCFYWLSKDVPRFLAWWRRRRATTP